MDNYHHYVSIHDKNLTEVINEVFKSVCLGRNCLSLTSCDELRRPMISLYPSEVIDFSSQYGPERSISYTINNIIGPPQIFPRYGDFTQSAVLRTYGNWWKKLRPTKVRRSRGSFISEDFITLSFPDFVEPSMVQLTETYNPGALVRIMAAEIRDEMIFRWVVLWEATQLSSRSYCNEARIFCPKFIRECHFYTNIIRLEFNSSNLPYYTEIDSVELFGHAKKKEEEDDDDDEDDVGSSVDPCDYNSPPLDGNSPPPTSPITALAIAFSSNCVATLHNLRVSKEAVAPASASLTGVVDSRPADTDECRLLKLPNEVLILICDSLDLKSLCRLSQTCRSFQELCYDESHYKSLDLQPYWHLVTNEMLSHMSERSHMTHSVNLSWCDQKISREVFKSFLGVCGNNLICLELNCCMFVRGRILKIISKACLNLEELHLQSCTGASAASFAFLKSLTSLRVLDLYRTLVDTESLLQIMSSCQKLERVNLGACNNNNECSKVLLKMARKCKNLKSLDLWRATGVTNDSLKKLAMNCKLLEELDLGWRKSQSSDEDFIQVIAESCPNLRKLFLTAHRTVYDFDVECIYNGCPRLEQLDLLGTSVTLTSIVTLLDRCTRLELLDLSFCPCIDYVELDEVVSRHNRAHSQQNDPNTNPGKRPFLDVKKSYQNNSLLLEIDI